MGDPAVKKAQLGVHPSTAAHQLERDLLFAHAVKGKPCFHCGGTLWADDWSIEHKKPWLHSEDPRGLFFDPSNIAFSHKSCNFGAARKFKRKRD